MTVEEMFQLLLNKITNLEKGQARLEASQAKLEASQAKLEASQARLEASQARLEASQAKLEENQARLEENQARLEEKIDTNFTKTLDMGVNLRLDLMDIGDKINNHHNEFRANRETTQSAITEIQVRERYQDIEIDRLKRKAS
ncbi:MAG: hypothetical protein HY819_10570 [Acidobacteria bacterium]|nr:hypothetical protein [Acidobacteriota bacterium]